MSPYQRLYQRNHLPKGLVFLLVERRGSFPSRRSLERNQPFLYPDLQAARERSDPSGFRYNASQQRGRHQPNQSYPDHRSADNASKRAAPGGLSCRTPQNHRVDDIYQSHHQRHVLTFYRQHSSCYSTHFAQKVLGDEQVLSHLAHLVTPCQLSRSLRSRGNSF